MESITPVGKSWSRFVPRQFGMRTLLGLTVIMALGAWGFTPLPLGVVTEQQAKRIKVGMTKTEVRAILGRPKAVREEKGWPGYWTYQVKDRRYRDEAGRFVVSWDFSSGTNAILVLHDYTD